MWLLGQLVGAYCAIAIFMAVCGMWLLFWEWVADLPHKEGREKERKERQWYEETISRFASGDLDPLASLEYVNYKYYHDRESMTKAEWERLAEGES